MSSFDLYGSHFHKMGLPSSVRKKHERKKFDHTGIIYLYILIYIYKAFNFNINDIIKRYMYILFYLLKKKPPQNKLLE